MRIVTLISALFALVAAPAYASEDAANEDQPIQVMVLGMYHFANPGLDTVNMEVDDVLSERRQREIAVLVNSLAEWQPTRITVENEAEPPSLELPSYADTDELLRTKRNESYQIGYRLARQLGHDAVYGYDERGSEEEPDYFPMGKVQEFAAENGFAPLLGELFASIQQKMGEEQERLPNQNIAESLVFHNDPDIVEGVHHHLYIRCCG